MVSFQGLKDFFFNEDPDNLEKIGSFYTIISIVCGYVVFVTYVGPRLMRGRKPFKLNKILITYNACIVLINAFITYKIGTHTYPRLYMMCWSRDSYDIDYHIKYIFKYAWWFYLSKYADLLDTLFFVLRKKWRQISFLHVFHHGTIVFVCWLGIYLKHRGLYLAFGMPINAFIHVCTYSYYTLAAFGPRMQKFLWWKKYLTFLQVGQFIVGLIFIFSTIALGCEELEPIFIIVIPFGITLLLLFVNFYNKNYVKSD
ncbi:very long chain fatty acid elongase 7-like isoform X2 [Parasteatoda tepidariorum]|uniref:very long chain fatty acid elongase 7-like isoform X2 n=1 Tax=Parasteatoda tepidariorum TaxID=114398 RepID=UPI00077F8D3B|nr:elongation of very long chain fatty acids protein 7-like [Parasteatoda tepidariorum]